MEKIEKSKEVISLQEMSRANPSLKLVDFHVHALNHLHYPVPAIDAELDDADKWSIAETLKAMKKAGRYGMVLADHNQFTSGLWAVKVGEELGIKVIPGAEVSLYYKGCEIHVIAAGITKITDELKDYFGYHTYPERFAKLVEEAGGVTYMTHPQYYPISFNDLLPYFNGYEAFNGGAHARGDVMSLEPDYLFEGFTTVGSDWHFGPGIHPEQVKSLSHVVPGTYIHDVFEKWL